MLTYLYRAPGTFIKAYAISGALTVLSIGWILWSRDLRGFGIIFASIQCLQTFLFLMVPAVLAGLLGSFSQQAWNWKRMAVTLACLYAVWGATYFMTSDPGVIWLCDF